MKDVTRFGENIPESLVWPLTRAALPDPEHRYESVDRLARTLAHAQDLLPALTPETPSLHLPFEEAS